MKDWIGNKTSIHSMLGSQQYAKEERVENDYYATEPKALEIILDRLNLNHNVWECACGEGHLSQVLEQAGHNVKSTDLIDRKYGVGGVDFLNTNTHFNGDILTNPPYKYAAEFVKHALSLVDTGNKVIMFLKLQFLEGKARGEMFKKYPPKYVYVSSGRLHCARNGDFANAMKNNAVCYCWFVWEKGYSGEPIVRWFN